MDRCVVHGEGPDDTEVLRTTLAAARHLLERFAGDPLLGRLLAAYHDMPPADRDAVVEAIEREVKARRLSLATEDVTGQAMHPSRHARLYVRTHGPEAQRSDLEREEMTQATLRGIRVMHLLFLPEIHATWRAATRDALAAAGPESHPLVERVARTVLELLAEVRGAPGAAAD
jgi:hypothetical protein